MKLEKLLKLVKLVMISEVVASEVVADEGGSKCDVKLWLCW